MQSLERKHPTAHRHVHTRTHTKTREFISAGIVDRWMKGISLLETFLCLWRRYTRDSFAPRTEGTSNGFLDCNVTEFRQIVASTIPSNLPPQQSTLAISSRSRIAELFHWRGWIVPRLRDSTESGTRFKYLPRLKPEPRIQDGDLYIWRRGSGTGGMGLRYAKEETRVIASSPRFP